MRVVVSNNRVHYRGYIIQGERRGEGWSIGVSASKPFLPPLRYGRFRAIRCRWEKCLSEIEMVIDETLTDAAKKPPANAKTPFHAISVDLVEDDETKRLRTLLSDTLTLLRERLKPRSAVETVLSTTQLEHVEKERLAPSTPKAS